MKIRTPILRPKGATGGLPASVFARRAHDRCQGLQSLVAIFPFLPPPGERTNPLSDLGVPV